MRRCEAQIERRERHAQKRERDRCREGRRGSVLDASLLLGRCEAERGIERERKRQILDAKRLAMPFAQVFCREREKRVSAREDV